MPGKQQQHSAVGCDVARVNQAAWVESVSGCVSHWCWQGTASILRQHAVTYCWKTATVHASGAPTTDRLLVCVPAPVPMPLSQPWQRQRRRGPQLRRQRAGRCCCARAQPTGHHHPRLVAGEGGAGPVQVRRARQRLPEPVRTLLGTAAGAQMLAHPGLHNRPTRGAHISSDYDRAGRVQAPHTLRCRIDAEVHPVCLQV